MFWESGIAYKREQSNIESVRNKVDLFLVRIERKMKHLTHCVDSLSDEFAEELTRELNLLAFYLREVRSRVLLFQVIDTVLDVLLVIKKTLIELILKAKVFALDYANILIAEGGAPAFVGAAPPSHVTF